MCVGNNAADQQEQLQLATRVRRAADVPCKECQLTNRVGGSRPNAQTRQTKLACNMIAIDSHTPAIVPSTHPRKTPVPEK